MNIIKAIIASIDRLSAQRHARRFFSISFRKLSSTDIIMLVLESRDKFYESGASSMHSVVVRLPNSWGMLCNWINYDESFIDATPLRKLHLRPSLWARNDLFGLHDTVCDIHQQTIESSHRGSPHDDDVMLNDITMQRHKSNCSKWNQISGEKLRRKNEANNYAKMEFGSNEIITIYELGDFLIISSSRN